MHLCVQNRRSRSMNLSAQSYRCSSIRLYPDQADHGRMNKQAVSNEKVIPVNETDFDSTVLQSEFPVFVDFYADWCGPCNMIAPTIAPLAEEHAGKVKLVKVHVEGNNQLEVAPRVPVHKGFSPRGGFGVGFLRQATSPTKIRTAPVVATTSPVCASDDDKTHGP